ncbi:MAG: hydrogenase nickel incorporation protein HypB [Desulfobacula sp.]|nr:hydrogenase nickel incorporation protein HypB [Desulfobacula sp.]
MDTVRLIEIKEDIHADNNAVAEKLRVDLSKEKTFLLNLMASPGAGKTTTILKTLEGIGEDIRVGVIEADIDSMVDAEKVAAAGTPAVQLRTGGFCHLDATMVKKGLKGLNTTQLDLVILENVGNLVCPAEFDTGAIKNAMILSVPEGDDKPLKYPLMFTVCDVLIINKIDYIELSDFDMNAMRERVLKLNPNIRIFEISAKTGQGIETWNSWLKDEVKKFLDPRI